MSINLKTAIIFAFFPFAAQADCGTDRFLNLMDDIHSRQWLQDGSREVETPEGPGFVNQYKTDYGFKRIDSNYCASNYCVSIVEVSTPESNLAAYFFHWGGVNFPESVEKTIFFVDRGGNESCMIRHTGGDQFKSGALSTMSRLESARGK